MPDVKDLYLRGLLIYVVKDAIRAEYNFAKGACCSPWISRADKREFSKDPDVSKNTAPNAESSRRIMSGDIGTNLIEICDRRLRPDYLVVHALAHDSTIFSTSS